MLEADVNWLKQRYESDARGKSEGRLIIRSEKSSSCYTTEVINKIFLEEGKSLFDSRLVQLGHTLQGGTPSPRDRTRAVRLSVRCISFLEHHAAKQQQARSRRSSSAVDATRLDRDGAAENIGMICVTGAHLKVVNLKEMVAGADMKKRRALDPWWLPLKGKLQVGCYDRAGV